MTSIGPDGTESIQAERDLLKEHEELAIIAETYWESMVSIARYTRELERQVDSATVERIRADVGLNDMAAMVIDDPTAQEAA